LSASAGSPGGEEDWQQVLFEGVMQRLEEERREGMRCVLVWRVVSRCNLRKKAWESNGSTGVERVELNLA
jgi:hypothetical protein